jgi:hypothetical protein
VKTQECEPVHGFLGKCNGFSVGRREPGLCGKEWWERNKKMMLVLGCETLE